MTLLAAAVLVMGAGWGIRGSFGHSRGAMLPGAMLGLVLAACSGRSDWWRRGAIVGLLAGIGWAFGGASSYGLLVGYARNENLATSIHGYAGLSLIGALYGSLGCGLVGLALTKPRRFLENALWPMVLTYACWLVLRWTGAIDWSLGMFAKDPDRPDETKWLYDTLWLCALVSVPLSALTLIRQPRSDSAPVEERSARAFSSLSNNPAILMLLMALGWWLSMSILVGAIGIRLNPGRNDTWAGVLGILLGLVVYLIWTKNFAALMLTSYGVLSGAIGFPLGMLLQALGRMKIGPMGSLPFLAELNHWTLMEQTFGYCMGLGAALGVLRLVRCNLAPASEDRVGGWLSAFSVWAILGLAPALNLPTNFKKWSDLELLTPTTMNVPTLSVLTWIVIGLLAVFGWVIVQQKRGRIDLTPSSDKGRIQILALAMMAVVLLLYLLLPSLPLPTFLMFAAALAIGSLCVIHAGQWNPSELLREPQSPDSSIWMPGWRFALIAILLPALLVGFGYCTRAMHH